MNCPEQIDIFGAFQKGRYRVRVAHEAAEIRAIQALRNRCFGAQTGSVVDWDAFDEKASQILVEDITDQQIVGGFRILPLSSGGDIHGTYSAQYYDLAALTRYRGRMLELGRFCIDPDRNDPDVVRIAWAALTRYVDQTGVEMLFGCSSFKGTNSAPYREVFALLKESHLAPKQWLPGIKAPSIFEYAQKLGAHKPDLKLARAHMPSLLRTYLLMGGWVSDHAVVDRQLNTLHVFTGVEIGAIPDNRKRLLRASAQ